MGTHLYDPFHSLETILEGNQELLKKFGGHVEFNGCKDEDCFISSGILFHITTPEKDKLPLNKLHFA